MDIEQFNEPLLAAVVRSFKPIHFPTGIVNWISDGTSLERFGAQDDHVLRLLDSIEVAELPNVGMSDASCRQLVLIDVASLHDVPMTETRVQKLIAHFAKSGFQVFVFVAYQSRNDIRWLKEPPWGSFAWCAGEPEHWIEFD